MTAELDAAEPWRKAGFLVKPFAGNDQGISLIFARNVSHFCPSTFANIFAHLDTFTVYSRVFRRIAFELIQLTFGTHILYHS